MKPDALVRNLGPTIIRLRLERGLTRPALLDRAIVSKTVLRKLETDCRHSPSTRTLANIAWALGIPLSELISETEKENTPK